VQRAPELEGFAKAVAHNAAKLMSYKDEYEVARLHSDGALLRKLRTQFEGDFKISFHLAPPLLSRRNSHTGEPRKIEVGAWALSIFKLLAKLKILRGTKFDIFGYSAERRAERRLIDDYFQMVEELCIDLTPKNHSWAVELAGLPDEIRGYGPVKERSRQAARRKEDQLLAAFRTPAVPALTGEKAA
jgi:indolepyruvate ferredoxin oxidoreductase